MTTEKKQEPRPEERLIVLPNGAVLGEATLIIVGIGPLLVARYPEKSPCQPR